MTGTQRRRAWRYHAMSWGPAAGYMVLIWVVSSFQDVSIPMERVPLRDKGIHALEYAVLGFLVTYAVRRTWPSWRYLLVAAVAFGLTTLWGLLDEIHQAFVPGRMADVLDLLADASGALVGTGLCAAWMRWKAQDRVRSLHL